METIFATCRHLEVAPQKGCGITLELSTRKNYTKSLRSHQIYKKCKNIVMLSLFFSSTPPGCPTYYTKSDVKINQSSKWLKYHCFSRLCNGVSGGRLFQRLLMIGGKCYVRAFRLAGHSITTLGTTRAFHLYQVVITSDE